MTYSPETQDPMAKMTPARNAGGEAPMAPAPPPPPSVAAAFFQGGIFAQFYVLFFINVAFFVGAILPWYGGPDARTGMFTLPGAILLYASIGSVLASLGSIYTRRVLIWPTLVTWLLADFFVLLRILGFLRENSAILSRVFSPDFKDGLHELGLHFGMGFAFILFTAVFFLLFMIVSVFIGAKQQAKKKEAQKQARAATRKGGARGKEDKAEGLSGALGADDPKNPGKK